MKYSILVLGASISISLFIKICCAVETNALYEGKSESGKIFSSTGSNDYGIHSEDSFLRNDEGSYRNLLKRTMLNDLRASTNLQNTEIESRVNGMVDDWIKDLESTKKERHQLREQGLLNMEGTGDELAMQIKNSHGLEYFNRQICGISAEPPTPSEDSCETDCKHLEEDMALPKGCSFDNTTKVLTCQDGEMTNIPPLPSELLKLDLIETKIANLSSDAFQNASIKQIRLFNNAISYIDPWAFRGVKDLTNLVINNNKNLAYLSYEMYVGLNDTETLDLRYNKVSLEIYKTCELIEPEDQIRIVFPKLSFFAFTGNPLIIIPKQMFAGLRESPLFTMYLDDCYLQWIHKDAFTYISGLKILTLAGNPGLSNSLESFMYPLTQLVKLDLSRMGLSSFPKAALSGLNQLEELYLQSNTFAGIDNDDLSDFPNLVELNLDDCKLISIDAHAFDGNPKLNHITLKNNRLNHVPANFPPSLQRLLMTREDDSFTLSDSRSFQNLPNLTYLEVGKVRINNISSDNAFDRLTSLTKMYLEGCNIQFIEDGAFQHLSKVNLLSLKGNAISEISPEAFKGMDSLNTLDMDDCQLTLSSYTSLPPEDDETSTTEVASSADSPVTLSSPFKILPKLERLKLSGNRITHLSSDLFEDIETLKYIQLNRNPIQSWKNRLFPDRIPTIYNVTAPDVPPSFEVEMKSGNLQVVTDAMIEDFLRMSKIDLSDNRFICDEGACKLRDIMNASQVLMRQDWINGTDYVCLETSTNTYHKIMNITDDACKSKAGVGDNIDEEENGNGNGGGGGNGGDIEKPGSTPEGSSTVIQLIIIAASVTLVAVVVILLAYRNRVHLRFFWFRVKYNVMPDTPRKAKLSTMESTVEYDYDVFISYHNEDSKFIADVFLPEIEQQESQLDGVNEIKSEIYLIENDKTSIMRNSQGPSKSSMDGSQFNQNKKKFKVCLHERDFVAGVPITENIVDCVDRSRKMIIFVSKKYMESQWCSFEMNLVYHRLIESRRKSFALVLLEDIPPGLRSKVLNYLMITKTYLQWPGMNGADEDKTSFWRRLRAFLQTSAD